MQERILDALRRGAHTEALTLARVAAAETPQDARIQALLAHAERANGHSKAAQDAIQRAVLLAPDSAEIHFQQAGFLLGEHRKDEAQTALARTLELDPNQFDAYILQAQLALGRGDLAEAERLQRTAARMAPDHPWTDTVEGMVALRRGDGARAQRLLLRAVERAPDDPQALYALGFAHLQQGQLAFAEQTFRKLIDSTPRMQNLRGLLADVLLRQQRPEEAREVLQPLLENSDTATPALKRMTAELDYGLGRHDSAMQLLRDALQDDPRDTRTLAVLTELWRRSRDVQDARATLDAALQTVPTHAGLWQTRLAFEEEASEGAQQVIERWLTAAPQSVSALEAQMHLHEAHGRLDERDALAQRIIELEPGRSSAELRVIDRLMREAPEQAVEHVRTLMEKAPTDAAREGLQPWLGFAQDSAGQFADAVATWQHLNAAAVSQRWPLTAATGFEGPWPAKATVVPGTPPVAYLVGLPGSGVEHIATVIGHAGYPLRADRFGAQPPQDPLQNPDAPAMLVDGRLSSESLLSQWQQTLPARGVYDGIIIDWLPFWDNALLKMTRPLQPEAIVMVAVRDPRDMLLEWMAFGSVLPYALPSPLEAAQWLGAQLRQIVQLASDDLQPHKLVRTDHAHADLEAFAGEVGGGLGLEEIRVPPEGAFGAPRFAFGHWRQYAKTMIEPFAALSDVAQALGYPAR